MIDLNNISFDHCIKCTICTVYCPVARATSLYPGPKHSGPDTERLRKKNPRLIDDSIKYCNNCKRCEIVCPSDVRIADIIQKAKQKYLQRKIRLRDYILSQTDMTGKAATLVSPLINFLLRLGPVRFLMDIFIKISDKKVLPNYNRQTFSKWYKKHGKEQNHYGEKAVYFHGCYVNYNNNELGKSVISVLNAMGVGAIVTDERCCGVPLIANGYIKEAKKNGEFNMNSLEKAVKDNNAKIISASSTCLLALKCEYPNILEIDNSAIYDRLEYITEFIYRKFESGIIPYMRQLDLHAAYHAPCHLERMGDVIYTIEILKRIPGLRLANLYSECCGISGTYGYKKENFDIAQDVGGDLFRKINSINPDVVITDCETCKMQIEMNTSYKVIHPVELLASAIKAD